MQDIVHMRRRLYHYPLSAPSRLARLALAEKRLAFQPIIERYWERRDAFLDLNPAGEVPVLEEPHHLTGTEEADDAPSFYVIVGAVAVCEYLDEIEQGDYSLIGTTPHHRAETRRLTDWFTRKFEIEVTSPLIEEKFMKRITRTGAPDSVRLRSVRHNLREHLAYIDWLVDQRRWIAGEQFSLADLACAGGLSCLDYLNEIDWEKIPNVRDWYARIKSRPSFRPLLEDHIAGIKPPGHYMRVDF